MRIQPFKDARLGILQKRKADKMMEVMVRRNPKKAKTMTMFELAGAEPPSCQIPHPTIPGLVYGSFEPAPVVWPIRPYDSLQGIADPLPSTYLKSFEQSPIARERECPPGFREVEVKDCLLYTSDAATMAVV